MASLRSSPAAQIAPLQAGHILAQRLGKDRHVRRTPQRVQGEQHRRGHDAGLRRGQPGAGEGFADLVIQQRGVAPQNPARLGKITDVRRARQQRVVLAAGNTPFFHRQLFQQHAVALFGGLR